MDPYEKTGEELKRQAEGPKRFAKTATAVGSALAGATSFSPILSRAAPFLSQYIPEDLAIKGLSKIHPNFGKFIKDGIDNGFSFDQLKEFMGKQINESQEETAKEDRNIIQQVSPELHGFIKEHVAGGRGLHEAGAIASKDKRFDKAIKQLTKQHKLSWADLLQQVYGPNPTAGKKGGMASEESDRFNQAYGEQQPQQQAPPGQQQPQQSGQGLDPGVAQIVQQVNSAISKFRGQG